MPDSNKAIMDLHVRLCPKSRQIITDIRGILALFDDAIEDMPWKKEHFIKIKKRFKRIIKNLELNRIENAAQSGT